jgi:uncharacterized spore protein YtfJ
MTLSAKTLRANPHHEEEAPMPVGASQAPAGGLLAVLASSIGGGAGARSVFGEPVERDGVTVIPVAGSRFGFGGGGGPTPDGRGEGAGGGGGAASRPLGFIEIRDGRTRFRRITNPGALGVAAVAIVAILARAAVLLRGGSCRTCARRPVSTPDEHEGAPGEEQSPPASHPSNLY